MNDLIKRSDVEDMLYDLFKNNAPEENEKIWNEAIGNVLDGLDEIESISDDMMKYLNFHKRNAISDLKKHNELKEGLEKGLEKGRKEIALKLKGKGMEVHEIAEITGISPEEAEKL